MKYESIVFAPQHLYANYLKYFGDYPSSENVTFFLIYTLNKMMNHRKTRDSCQTFFLKSVTGRRQKKIFHLLPVGVGVGNLERIASKYFEHVSIFSSFTLMGCRFVHWFKLNIRNLKFIKKTNIFSTPL